MDQEQNLFEDRKKNPSMDDDKEEAVEKEDLYGKEGENQITKPFDPSQIDVDIANVNLGSLIDQIANDEIDLQPDFQRSSDIWDGTQKSRLIESILLGLPLPSFYFSEDLATGKLSIIDGLQRICAIRDFIIKKEEPLVLQNLQFLRSFEGKTYKDLERPEIRRIQSLKITTNTLRKSTPNEVKYVIFQRVNTAGVPLEPQEMRHALNQGKPAQFMKKLADLEAFKIATNHSIKSKRMLDRDFANRFVAFYTGFNEYNGELDAFLNNKMGALKGKTDDELKNIKEAFEKSMNCCYTIFDKYTFRKRSHPRDKRKRISKSVFDTLSVNIAWLTDEERQSLIKRKSSFKQRMMALFNEPKFSAAISTGTAKTYSVVQRFNAVKDIIQEVLNNDK